MPSIVGGKNITDSAQINTGVVTADDIATDAVDSAEIKDGSVRTQEIANDTILAEDINSAAAIPDSKLATISTAGKVDGAALTNLANIPAGAGVIPSANLPGGSDLTCFPLPVQPTDGVSTRALNNPVDGYIGLFRLVRGITLNKLTVNVTAVGGSGTFKVAIYSEDGQTKYGEATSGTVSGGGEVTLTFSNLVLPAGNLWFLFVSVGAANITVSRYGIMGTVTALKDVSSEPSTVGVLTVTSGTPPATVTVSSISATEEGCMVIRLDN